ncbi:roquin-1 isoform X2 [Ixodes scapularis]|uniref:roquin-1 isoform X2 n=1 Tax=Ixodes scapularis TaxID=6945 RepID=UPI001A9F0707|nr:roquin-1 isoform X2 [Ixodes scapularis]
MPVQAPQWTEFLSCPVCCRAFDGAERRPTSLGCGHTLCGRCLGQLQRRLCPFDQAPIGRALPENGALLQLVAVAPSGPLPVAPPGALAPPTAAPPGLEPPQLAAFRLASRCIQEMALLLRPAAQGGCGGWLSRPLQRKLVTLVHCQLAEPEGRLRAVRAARSLGERCAMELLLQHQSGQQLSASLWAAVRARGCQFLGPHMQEEVLRLVLLALEDGSPLSRKVLVLFVVQRLAPHFPQASKTSIGHVVQLLYRASCFKVSKREGDSSLMQLKEEFCTYEALRREHDAQIVQIATEAGLRIAPEQWSSLLYGDTAHKSHMQSIIDKLQSPQSFGQSVQELVIALQRTGDPGSLSLLRPHLELLSALDPSPEASWEEVGHSVEAAHAVVHGLVGFLGSFGGRGGKPGPDAPPQGKYKTSLCRDLAQRGSCPRGVHCTFAHSQDEVDRYRGARGKRAHRQPGVGPPRTTSPAGLHSLLGLPHVVDPADGEVVFPADGTVPGRALNPESAAFHPPTNGEPPQALQEAKKRQQQNQDIASQSLAELQQRKQEIMAKLGEPQELQKVPAFSPWTSAALFEHAAAGASSPAPVAVTPLEVSPDTNNGEEPCHPCPSEEDPFVPFDPPLVSKYGPISRCARSLVRGPAPIQVTSQRGDLTSPTAALRHPLPSASAAPSLYAQGFALPLALVPAAMGEPLLSLVDPPLVLKPVAPLCGPPGGFLAPLRPLLPQALGSGAESGGRLRERLQQELRLVQQSIEHREKIIAQCEDDLGELGLCKLQLQQRQERPQVPTSVGPWMLEQLEQTPRQQEDIEQMEQHWLQELEKDEPWEP